MIPPSASSRKVSTKEPRSLEIGEEKKASGNRHLAAKRFDEAVEDYEAALRASARAVFETGSVRV